jgi:hypothetical protein
VCYVGHESSTSRGLYTIGHAGHACFGGTVSAAEAPLITFHAVADDAATAVVALGGEGVNGAFKTVEGVRLIVHDDDKCFVVGVATDFTSSHERSPVPIDMLGGVNCKNRAVTGSKFSRGQFVGRASKYS